MIIVTGFMAGCENSGYLIIINTNEIKYDDLKQIGNMLKDKGFQTKVWERKTDMPKYSDKVYTLFEKRVSSKPYYTVGVHLTYEKGTPNNIVRNLEVDVHNIYKGMSVAELREEIDRIGDWIYQELIDKVGGRNVAIKSKEIHGQAVFLMR
jgi:hypothetical protein